MGRSPCCSKEGLNRGAWTAHEDKILMDYIKANGEGRWRNLPKRAGLKRCGKSCRLRWLNYLRPDIKRGNISADEEELIIKLHKLLGNRWSLIAGRLPGRTDNEIKNYWNTNLSKKIDDGRSKLVVGDAKSEKSSGIIMKKIEATTTGGTSLTSVVRTRATRCSKVFINNSQKIELFDTKREAKHSTCSKNNQTLSEFKQLPIMSESENEVANHIPSEFTFDFNVGELFLSDILNSEFCDVNELSYNNVAFGSSPSQDQPLIFSDEMLKCGFESPLIDGSIS